MRGIIIEIFFRKGVPAVKKSRYAAPLAFLCLWIALIFGHSCMTGSVSASESRGLLELLQPVFPWLTAALIRKLGHIVEFFTLGVLASVFFRRLRGFSMFKPLCLSLFVALCDESIQLLIPGRSGRLPDVWLDFGAAGAAFLLCWLIYKLKK